MMYLADAEIDEGRSFPLNLGKCHLSICKAEP